MNVIFRQKDRINIQFSPFHIYEYLDNNRKHSMTNRFKYGVLSDAYNANNRVPTRTDIKWIFKYNQNAQIYTHSHLEIKKYVTLLRFFVSVKRVSNKFWSFAGYCEPAKYYYSINMAGEWYILTVYLIYLYLTCFGVYFYKY